MTLALNNLTKVDMQLNNENKPINSASVICLHTVKWSNSFINNNSIELKSIVCAQFRCQRVLFDPLRGLYQVLPIPGQSGSEYDGSEEVLRLSQNPSITGASPPDYLVSYPGHLLGVTLSAEMLLVYSIALIDWVIDPV